MNAPLRLTPEGQVQVHTGKVELGQGLHHALAQLVAATLEWPLHRVQVMPVDTAHSPDQGVTSGSLSVQEAGRVLREACLELRQTHEAELARWRRPSEPAARLGASLPRPALAALFKGEPPFIHDLQPAGLRHGRVLHPPLLGQRAAAEWNQAAVAACPGVLGLLRDGELFGLVATTSAQADAALRVLQKAVHWLPAPEPQDDSAEGLRHKPAASRCVGRSGDGPANTAWPANQQLSARYTKPWVAHASIGPSCALAVWSKESQPTLEVWSHSQGIFNLRRDLALAFHLPVESVRVHHEPGAGCYGHNGADDVAFDAAWLARTQPGHTVRVVWSRADELSLSPCGPAMAMELSAQWLASGAIVHWRHDVWSPGHSRRPGRSSTPALLGAWQVADAFAPPPSIDMPLSVGGGAERNALPGYAFPAFEVHAHSVTTQRRSSALRALGALGNVFAAESFMDEIAHAQGVSPLALRRQHLAHDARALAVLNAVAAFSGLETPRRAQEEGVGFGLGLARYKNTGAWCAVVAQVHAAERLRVRRLTLVVDVGQVVNPDGVLQQIEGGALQATSWALLESAAVTHAGWSEYPILRFEDVPEVAVHILPSSEPSLGAGEAALGPTAAAIANALFNAIGVRVRDLPLTPERILHAIHAQPL